MKRVLLSVWVKRIERRGSSWNLFGADDTQEMRQLWSDWPIRLMLETMLSSLEKNLEGTNITPPTVVLAYSRVSSLKCILPRTLMLSIVTSFFPVPTTPYGWATKISSHIYITDCKTFYFLKKNAHLNHLCLKSMSFCTALCRMASAVAGSDRQRCMLRIC